MCPLKRQQAFYDADRYNANVYVRSVMWRSVYCIVWIITDDRRRTFAFSFQLSHYKWRQNSVPVSTVKSRRSTQPELPDVYKVMLHAFAFMSNV